MSALQTQLAGADREEKAAAWRSYVELVQRADAPEDADADRIREVCTLLSIPIADMEADHRAFKQLPGFLERGAECKDLEQHRLALQSKKQEREHELKIQAKRDAQELAVMRRDLASCAHKLDIAQTAASQADHLRRRHWRIFGSASPAPDAVPGLGTVHPKELAAWLNAEPPVLAYAHDGERAVVSAIRAAGYKPGQPGEWIRKDGKK